MKNHKILKIVRLSEKESKYTVVVDKQLRIGDREFIIYQWYTVNKNDLETKVKLIVDLLNVVVKWVKVTKKRTSMICSDKTVEYLDCNSVNIDELIGFPFVLKRRSIFNDFHLDTFVHSNGLCDLLLENEGDYETTGDFCEENNITILQDVSTNIAYRNVNLCIPFDTNHANNLSFLLSVLNYSNFVPN